MSPLNRSLISNEFYIWYLYIFLIVLTPHDRNWSNSYSLTGVPTFSLLCTLLAGIIFWTLQSHIFLSLTIPILFFYNLDTPIILVTEYLRYWFLVWQVSDLYPLQFILLFLLNLCYSFSPTTLLCLSLHCNNSILQFYNFLPGLLLRTHWK